MGEFINCEMFLDHDIIVRFIWTRDGSSSCRWEQAFSDDDGKTWETNWTMDYTRVGSP